MRAPCSPRPSLRSPPLVSPATRFSAPSPLAATSSIRSSRTGTGNDSWVTSTGTHVGSQVALDPSFVEFDSYGEPIAGVDAQIPNGAGWYDATPGTQNLINQANGSGGFRIQLMQIVRLAGDDSVASQYLKIGFKVANTTTAIFGEGTFSIGVPAPGALALLGVAGLAGRRRR